MIIFDEIVSWNFDFHSFLDKRNSKLFEVSHILFNFSQNFFLFKFSAPKHSNRIPRTLISHFQLANSLSKHLQQHLLWNDESCLDLYVNWLYIFFTVNFSFCQHIFVQGNQLIDVSHQMLLFNSIENIFHSLCSIFFISLGTFNFKLLFKIFQKIISSLKHNPFHIFFQLSGWFSDLLDFGCWTEIQIVEGIKGLLAMLGSKSRDLCVVRKCLSKLFIDLLN